jgi:hypothetical protein
MALFPGNRVLIIELQSRIGKLEADVAYYREKCDRLNEALLKRDSQVVVQLPPAPMVRTELPAVPVGPTERTESWVGRQWISGGHAIATPPKVLKSQS